MIEGAGITRMFTVSGLVEFGSSNFPLYDFRSGGPIDQPFEIRAECQGMQWLTRVATSLGTTADDAQAIANYYTVIYPTRKALANGPYPYWVCRLSPRRPA
jgi:hypothetical protein